MIAPDWLVKRDGALVPGLGAGTTLVMLSGQPYYRLNVRPAGGTFACTITNSVNGQRTEDVTKTYPDPDAALAGGLDQLRANLGW